MTLYAMLRQLRSCSCHGPVADLVDLLSFPTRRSSDLVGAAVLLGGARQVGPARELGAAGPQQRASGFDLRREHLDRKSTRLNSSHLGISYAVFCLKKKSSGQLYSYGPR